MQSSAEAAWTLDTVAPGMQLGGGHLERPDGEPVEEENPAGLKLVLVLEGELQYVSNGFAPAGVSGPSLHLGLSRERYAVTHRFAAKPLRYVAVRLPPSTLCEAFDFDVDGLSRAWPAARATLSTTLADRAADVVAQRLGRQILACPLHGAVRALYLAGKSLELAAIALSGAVDGDRGAALALPVRERARLQGARELLESRLEAPPTLPELARLVGTNVNKLTRGFRALFGCSVYDFVRERRMELAYRLLSAGEISVAAAAERCGYTDSHFAKAFRRRYGMAPSALG